MKVNFEFFFFFTWLSALESPHVIEFTVVCIEHIEVSLYKIKTYNFSANCNNEYRAGGVKVYIHTFLHYKLSSNTFFTTDVIHITVKIQKFNFYLFAIYRQHSLYKINFYKEDGEICIC